MPAAKPSDKKTATKREGPTPAHLLIASIRDAVEAGVDRDKIVAALDFARGASGASQAPVWRAVSTMLTQYVTDEADEGTEPGEDAEADETEPETSA